jgi:hypothetical protein
LAAQYVVLVAVKQMLLLPLMLVALFFMEQAVRVVLVHMQPEITQAVVVVLVVILALAVLEGVEMLLALLALAAVAAVAVGLMPQVFMEVLVEVWAFLEQAPTVLAVFLLVVVMGIAELAVVAVNIQLHFK